MKQYILLILIGTLTSCHPGFELLKDLEKDGFSGSVKSVEVFASKKIAIAGKATPDEYKRFQDLLSGKSTGWVQLVSRDGLIARDTLYEILLTKTLYNLQGNKIEYIRYQHDKILANWNYGQERSCPEEINTEIYMHDKYTYNSDNLLESISHLNPDGSTKSISKITFVPNKRRYIDSTFYCNGGLESTSTAQLTKYGLYVPVWIKYESVAQFDQDNNIIVDGEIHYYYHEYDKHGNWIEATKYYEGPDKKNPVQLRRRIEYY